MVTQVAAVSLGRAGSVEDKKKKTKTESASINLSGFSPYQGGPASVEPGSNKSIKVTGHTCYCSFFEIWATLPTKKNGSPVEGGYSKVEIEIDARYLNVDLEKTGITLTNEVPKEGDKRDFIDTVMERPTSVKKEKDKIILTYELKDQPQRQTMSIMQVKFAYTNQSGNQTAEVGIKDIRFIK